MVDVLPVLGVPLNSITNGLDNEHKAFNFCNSTFLACNCFNFS